MGGNSSHSCLIRILSEVDRQFLGDGGVPAVPPPDFVDLQRYLIPLGLDLQHAVKFFEEYSATCGVSQYLLRRVFQTHLSYGILKLENIYSVATLLFSARDVCARKRSSRE